MSLALPVVAELRGWADPIDVEMASVNPPSSIRARRLLGEEEPVPPETNDSSRRVFKLKSHSNLCFHSLSSTFPVLSTVMFYFNCVKVSTARGGPEHKIRKQSCML